jgi:Spy/CpxP family protein refolding chaperone
MTKPWQIWLVLIAIFFTGVTGGLLLERHIAHRQVPRPPPPDVWVARQMERIAGEVQLTPEQKERIRPIIAANIDQLIKLRRQAIDILDQMGKQIAAELTPEQRAKYERILQERREARELHGARHRADRPPPGGDGPPPEPGNRPPPPIDKAAGT